MWEKVAANLLKVTPFGAIFAFFYPVVTIIRVHCFGSDGGITTMVLSFMLMLAGVLVTLLFIRKEYSILKLVIACILSLIPGACAIIQFHNLGLGRAIFEAAVCILFYITGIRGYLAEYWSLFSGIMLQVGVVVLTGVLVTAHFYEEVLYLKGYFFLAAYVFILFSLIVRSRENMNMVFHGRGVSQPEVQGKINKYRRHTIIALYTAILLLFNLKNIIVLIIKLIGIVANKIMELIIYIIKLLFHHKGGTYEQQFGFMPFDPRPSPLPIVILILYATGYFILLLTIYKLSPVLYKKLRAMYRKMLDLIKALSKKRRLNYIDGCGECVDVIEIVEVENDNKNSNRNKTGIKERMRQLKNTLEPEKKVRIMYGIILDILTRNDLNIDKSNTTGEIFNKVSNDRSIGECMYGITKTYDVVRYGEKIPANMDMCEYESRFMEIIYIKKGRENRG